MVYYAQSYTQSPHTAIPCYVRIILTGYKYETLDAAMMNISQKPREELLKTKPKKKNNATVFCTKYTKCFGENESNPEKALCNSTTKTSFFRHTHTGQKVPVRGIISYKIKGVIYLIICSCGKAY
ncbi:unnamed protein product, partial [Coregonus sp. 'balchen']